jgi:steroid delta-isomerase-like uncharacterized protein
MAVLENKTLVRHFWEDGYNGRDLSVVITLFAANYIHHSNDVPLDRSAFLVAAESFQRSFPDSKVQIEQLIGEDDMVVVRWRFTGTHTAESDMFGMPTGQLLSFPSTWVYRIADGKICEDWETWDTLTLADRLQPPNS